MNINFCSKDFEKSYFRFLPVPQLIWCLFPASLEVPVRFRTYTRKFKASPQKHFFIFLASRRVRTPSTRVRLSHSAEPSCSGAYPTVVWCWIPASSRSFLQFHSCILFLYLNAGLSPSFQSDS